MYFERLEEDFTIIDGKNYKVQPESTNNMFNCRSALFEIYYLFDGSVFDMRVNPDEYLGWKKDLQKACKNWDGLYQKHIKAKVWDEMQAIHTQAMEPLTELIKANRAYHFIELMIKDPKNEVPEFRI